MEKLLEHIRSKRGRLRDLAKALDVSPSTILTWRQVPPLHCLKIERLTGVSRYDLRPDIYGDAGEDIGLHHAQGRV